MLCWHPYMPAGADAAVIGTLIVRSTVPAGVISSKLHAPPEPDAPAIFTFRATTLPGVNAFGFGRVAAGVPVVLGVFDGVSVPLAVGDTAGAMDAETVEEAVLEPEGVELPEGVPDPEDVMLGAPLTLGGGVADTEDVIDSPTVPDAVGVSAIVADAVGVPAADRDAEGVGLALPVREPLGVMEGGFDALPVSEMLREGVALGVRVCVGVCDVLGVAVDVAVWEYVLEAVGVPDRDAPPADAAVVGEGVRDADVYTGAAHTAR